MTAFTTNYHRVKSHCILFFFITLFFSLAISSCVLTTGNHLRTVEAKPSEVAGTYTLFLYGCRYPDDLENVAILAREGYPYTFDIYAPSSRYKVKSGLPADEALREAEQFISCSVHYQQSRLSAISEFAGNIIGFEVRPLYSPIRFGMYDVLNIQYVNKDGRIVVYIKLDPTVEMELRDGRGRENRDVK
jgi:hypothetical protein